MCSLFHINANCETRTHDFPLTMRSLTAELNWQSCSDKKMKIETTRANFKVYFLDLRLPSIPSNLYKTIQLVCKEQTLIYSLEN